MCATAAPKPHNEMRTMSQSLLRLTGGRITTSPQCQLSALQTVNSGSEKAILLVLPTLDCGLDPPGSFPPPSGAQARQADLGGWVQPGLHDCQNHSTADSNVQTSSQVTTLLSSLSRLPKPPDPVPSENFFFFFSNKREREKKIILFKDKLKS